MGSRLSRRYPLPVEPPSRAALTEILESVRGVRAAVFGDLAVDAYWDLDAEPDELSLETGRPISRVKGQSYGLGGAGNVVANLARLGVGSVEAIGVVGPDPFGRELCALLEGVGAGTAGILHHEGWQTVVFAKPHQSGIEQDRIDFGGLNQLDPELEDAVIERLVSAARRCDVVVINQQVPRGLAIPPLIERLDEVIEAHPKCVFLADSRDHVGRFHGVIRKLNLHEARRRAGGQGAPPREVLRRLVEELGGRVFMTLGEDGLMTAQAGVEELLHVPAPRIVGEVDTVGAGDAVTAAIAGVLGAGGDPRLAAHLAVLAAAVTVKKLRRTGTASPAEILEAARW